LKIKSEFYENVIELDQSTPLSFFDVANYRAMFKRVAAFDPHQCASSQNVNHQKVREAPIGQTLGFVHPYARIDQPLRPFDRGRGRP